MTRHLLVTNDFPPKVGGIQNYLWELWRRLDPASFVVLTASSHPDAPAFDAAQADALGVSIVRVPESILFFPTPTALAHVRRCVEEYDIDLVLFDPALPLGLLGPRIDVPYGVILHGAEVAVPGRVPGARAALSSRSLPVSIRRPSSPSGHPSGVRPGSGSVCRPKGPWW
jgi:phosphatidylinositol alpha-1,6-mannosyltransferase